MHPRMSQGLPCILGVEHHRSWQSCSRLFVVISSKTMSIMPVHHSGFRITEFWRVTQDWDYKGGTNRNPSSTVETFRTSNKGADGGPLHLCHDPASRIMAVRQSAKDFLRSPRGSPLAGPEGSPTPHHDGPAGLSRISGTSSNCLTVDWTLVELRVSHLTTLQTFGGDKSPLVPPEEVRISVMASFAAAGTPSPTSPDGPWKPLGGAVVHPLALPGKSIIAVCRWWSYSTQYVVILDPNERFDRLWVPMDDGVLRGVGGVTGIFAPPCNGPPGRHGT